MDFLRKLFSGGGNAPGDIGLYYYVRCNRCSEVIRVRINPNNDLSINDDHNGLHAHKMIVGKRCYNRIDADFYYDKSRRFKDASISGGDLVKKDDFVADQEAHPEPKS
jgi:hypothetical protein